MVNDGTLTPMEELTLNIYAWLMAVFFGAVLSETTILYPNIFYNVPDSLQEGMNFLKVIGPHQFFMTLGTILITFAIITNVVNRKNRQSRKYLVSSLALLILFEFLFSVIYFWPRNQVMFVEGAAFHSEDELRRVAVEFQRGHFIRLAAALAASVLAFLAAYRTKCAKHNNAKAK